MANHSFDFLDKHFPDISKFCMRMEKNIVEGDGVDAVIWAGKIAERITSYLTRFIDLDLKDLQQNEKLERLYKEEVFNDKIYNDFNTIRYYRNIATHRDLRNELIIANKLHRTVFNIICWFYGNYLRDDSYFSREYVGVTYQHDSTFIDMITGNVNLDGSGYGHDGFSQADMHSANLNAGPGLASDIPSMDPIANQPLNTNFISYSSRYINQDSIKFNEELNCYTAVVHKNNKIITVGHYKTREKALKNAYNYVSSDEFKNYTYISIPPKLKGGVYSYSKGINFSEKNSLWTASFNKKFLGYFISESSAIVARKEYIDTLPLPEKKNGSYSRFREIFFDENHRLWYINKDNEVHGPYDSEEEAIEELSNLFVLKIGSEDLGIFHNPEDSKWRFFYKGKFIAAYDSESEAIEKRLKYVSTFAQPKRNRNGEFSIHKGIFYDERNLIWAVKVKDEIIGFSDTEEAAFNIKKDFLMRKGFDVSNLNFNEEETVDYDSYDFKVRIYSDENSVYFDENANEWIILFRGIEIGRANDEDDARRLRRNHLKNMPFPPRKPNGEYSNYDGVDYDIDSHLWLARNGDELLGYFDSEEDAFYAIKEELASLGEDVSEMHFGDDDSRPETLDADSEDGSLIDENSHAEGFGGEDESALADDSVEDNGSVLSFAESDEEGISNLPVGESVESTGSEILTDGPEDAAEKSLAENEESIEIESYKSSQFYGIGLKEDYHLDAIEDDDLDSESEEIEDLIESDLTEINLKDNGFSNLSKRKDLKEIKFKSFDSNNYRREISIYYSKSEIFVSLEGMIRNSQLDKEFFFDRLDNVKKLNFESVNDNYMDFFICLKFDLMSFDFNYLVLILLKMGWEFDLLSSLNSSNGSIGNDDLGSSIGSIADSISEGIGQNKPDLNQTGIVGRSDSADIDNGSSVRKIYPRADELRNRQDGNSSKGGLDSGDSSDSYDSLNSIDSNDSDEVLNSKEGIDIKDKGTVSKVDEVSDSSKRSNGTVSKANELSDSSKKRDYSKANSKAFYHHGSSSKTKVIRNGKVVTLEEAQELDNKVEQMEIKSNLVSKRPEKVKRFKTSSIGDLLKSPRGGEEGDAGLEDSGLGLARDETNSKSYYDLVGYNGVKDYSDKTALEDNNVDEETDADDIIEAISQDEDKLIETNSQEVSDEVLNDSDAFKDESANVSVESHDLIDSEISEDKSENVSVENPNLKVQEGESNENTSAEESEESSPSIEQVTKKPKANSKPKKVKRIAEDAFDDRYKDALEIEYGEEKGKWSAYIDGEFFKSFDTPKEAYIERKKRLRRLIKLPRRRINGMYSELEGISFDAGEWMWTSSVNGVIINYSTDERSAFASRKFFVDEILPRYEIEEDEFTEDDMEIIFGTDMEEFLDGLDEEDFVVENEKVSRDSFRKLSKH